MIDRTVSASVLAPFLLLDRGLEIRAEPFRCQRNVRFIIDIEEYKKFIAEYLDRVDVLYTKTAVLKSYIQSGNLPKLRSSFYHDIALAVGKELFYATSDSADCTTIIHEEAGNESIPELSLEKLRNEYFMARNAYEDKLKYSLEIRNFPIPKYIPCGKNTNMWMYAVVLEMYANFSGASFGVSNINFVGGV